MYTLKLYGLRQRGREDRRKRGEKTGERGRRRQEKEGGEDRRKESKKANTATYLPRSRENSPQVYDSSILTDALSVATLIPQFIPFSYHIVKFLQGEVDY